MSNTPSDEELNSVLCHHWPAFSMQAVLVQMWLRDAMRAALAKWGTPQPADCTRSHPHEDMSGYCLLRTEIARLANENARLKAGQPVELEPLTDEQIDVVMRKALGYGLSPSRDDLDFVRAIERAHGITQKGGTPQTVVREPLIADEICDAWEFVTGYQIQFGPSTEGRPMFLSTDEVIEFARAIEAAHGITGGQHG